ncbi:hypothetical protein CHCC14431_1715 [Bacillus licheniformis]|nr:hypothetical protein CHCC14431_1715 [Bacillus licheniformis]
MRLTIAEDVEGPLLTFVPSYTMVACRFASELLLVSEVPLFCLFPSRI